MILDLAPGDSVQIDGFPFSVEESSTFHDIDFRMDLVRLTGPTPAHERWLVAVLPEPYLMLVQRLEQDWLAAPRASIVHDGEIFASIYQGGGHRQRRGRPTRGKEGRTDYTIFRSDSGRVIVTIGQNDNFEAWIGTTLMDDEVRLPKRS